MIGNFKSNLPYNNFLLLIYGLILKWALFVHPLMSASLSGDTLFFVYMNNMVLLLGHSTPLLYSGIVFVLIYFQAIFLNKIVINQRLFSKPNYLTGMSYLLITALFPFWATLSPELVAATILIWILSIISKLSNTPDPKKTLFNVGLLLGITALIFFPSILFLLLVLVGLSVMRPFRLTEWIILFLGLATPFYFLWSYGYLFDKSNILLFTKLSLGLPSFSLIKWEVVAVIVILILLSVGFYFVQFNMRRLLVQSRNTWAVIMFYFMLSLLIPFVDEHATLHNFFFAITPISILIAAAFIYPVKKWFAILFHWTLVILSVIIGLYETLH